MDVNTEQHILLIILPSLTTVKIALKISLGGRNSIFVD